MTISVGIPSHNQGEFLAEALDALLNQTVPPDEIVVSDDNSTDETVEVLRRYAGRIRIIRPPQRLSMVAHFNYLVDHMSGDWFAVLGGDDVAKPEFVEHLSHVASKHREAVLVRGGWQLIAQDGRLVGHHRLWSTATVTTAPRTFLEELGGPKPCLSAVLFRRAAWLGFPTSLRHSFDWGLYLLLSTIGSFVTTHHTVVKFRTGCSNSKIISRLVDKAHDERVVALEIAPTVAEILGVPAQPTLTRAAERRLDTILAEADIATDEEVRSRVVTELRPLATALGREKLMEDFMSRRRVPSRSRFNKLWRGANVMGPPRCALAANY